MIVDGMLHGWILTCEDAADRCDCLSEEIPELSGCQSNIALNLLCRPTKVTGSIWSGTGHTCPASVL